MKKIVGSVFMIVMFLLSSPCAWAKKTNNLGVGVAVGDPFGPTIKYWIDDNLAVDVGMAFQDETILYADFLWHSWELFDQIKEGDFGGYIGLGARVITETEEDDEVSIRAPFGLDYLSDKRPLELFFEIAPLFQVTPENSEIEFDVLFGIRFYLGQGQ